MPKVRVFNKHHFPAGSKEVIKIADLEILVIQHEGGLAAVQARCPHAGAPLNEGAVCNGRIICPWHMGTFDLRTGELLEPPPMGPLKCYAVEVDGEEVFVETDPLPAATRELNSVSQDATFLLVGAGAAGTMAAVTLRARGFAGRVIMVDPVPEEPVDRTVLSKMALSGEMPLAKAKLDSLDNLNVERITASVVSMSAAKRECLLSNGRRVIFDRALVATGGRPKRLQIAGAEVAHVIRHSDDVKRILDACERSKTAVIIGTGFIGLEAASALIQKGLQVTVVGQEGLPLEKQLGKANATSLLELHVRNGTSFQLGVEVVRIESDAVVIRKSSQEIRLPADLVVMGVGVTPEPDFQHDLPCASERGGIRADENLRAADSVWVAGDIANINGLRIEHWRLAQQHGRRAALGMLDLPAASTGVPFFWTYHFGKRIDYLGHAEKWDHILTRGQFTEKSFLAFYVQHGLIRAVLSCEAETETALLAELMREPLTVDLACRHLKIELQRQL